MRSELLVVAACLQHFATRSVSFEVALFAHRTPKFCENTVFRARAQPPAVLMLVIDERFRVRAPFH